MFLDDKNEREESITIVKSNIYEHENEKKSREVQKDLQSQGTHHVVFNVEFALMWHPAVGHGIIQIIVNSISVATENYVIAQVSSYLLCCNVGYSYALVKFLDYVSV